MGKPISESQRIREEALANARLARETIGEETLDKLAAAIRKHENSKMTQLRRQIEAKEPDRVAAEILAMMDDE